MTILSPPFSGSLSVLVRCALVLGLAVISLRAQTITSLADFSPPFVGVHSYILGFAQPTGTHELLLVTTAEIYSSTVSSPGSALTFTKIHDLSSVFNPQEGSAVVANPQNPSQLVYSAYVAFSPTLVTVTMGNPAVATGTTMTGASAVPGALAIDSAGATFAFVPDMGVGKYTSDGTLALTLGGAGSGAGTLGAAGRGMALGADGLLYVLDSANSRVARFDATTGSYAGSFGVTGTTTATALAVSETGRRYLSNGSGGGTIYDVASGSSLGNFSSSGGSVDPGAGGAESLLLDGRGYLYLYDANTRLHVFHDPASVSAIPEPGTYAALAGIIAVGFAAVRRRRRAATPSAPAPKITT